MWIRTRTNEMVNIEEYRVIRVEATSVLARKLDDHSVLFHGDEAACQRVFVAILDSLVLGVPLFDMATEGHGGIPHDELPHVTSNQEPNV